MEKKLIAKAFEIRDKSYAPYSRFKVGAALLTQTGNIYRGCNVENASYGATICAERSAALSAVANGDQHFVAIAIAGFYDADPIEERAMAFPCGICRQFIREFCTPKDMKIIVARSETDYITTTLEELLPNSFGPEMVER